MMVQSYQILATCSPGVRLNFHRVYFDSLFHCQHALGFVSLLLVKIVEMLCISGTELNSKSIRGENLDINAGSVLKPT